MSRSEADTILLTGGAGFIGSHVVERLVGAGYRVINLDLLTYAGNLDNLASLAGSGRHLFVKGDICDRQLVAKLLADHRPAVLFNIAAESHVDRSIDDAAGFIRTNVTGVFELLDVALAYWRSLSGAERDKFRFIQMSTDEVYGSIDRGEFTEDSPYAPNSPYAASKAAGDHLVRAYRVTHALPIVLVHASNTYGPRQYPEKLIPHMILTALKGEKLPVYGDGQNVRDWMHVDDLARGLEQVVAQGRVGETYNFAGCDERSNIETVRLICSQLDRLRQKAPKYESQISFVRDRPGHDRRYALNADKVKRELGWRPATPFETGLAAAVEWYLANNAWCDAVLRRGYEIQRIGVNA
jgi:dTDP-glucose 4,6-dehydratase